MEEVVISNLGKRNLLILSLLLDFLCTYIVDGSKDDTRAYRMVVECGHWDN